MSVLFNTKLRQKLLGYTFTHHDENYYVRELSALVDADPGNVSRELRRLEAEGLFASTTKGKVKFYSLNKKYPLFQELKTIVFKTEGVEGSLKKLVAGYKGLVAAFIYGSYAKNKENRASDVDLVAVGAFNRNHFTRDINSLERKLNREINFTMYGVDEFENEREKAGGFLNVVLKDKIVLLKGSIHA
jgi:predicted nucleotidyltransferase/predicted transcriptional regulator with HTH domain